MYGCVELERVLSKEKIKIVQLSLCCFSPEIQQWYNSSMNVICTWLTDRMDLQLHIYQLKTLIRMVKKTYRDFRLQGVLDSTLNSKTYETIRNRLTVEEATASVSEGGGLQGISMKDSDEEDEEDD
ncbi:hypothetical protein CB1_000353019 [Camelus ferus]|nr:hypothetical protein CB1_000353019 [Camelus ferus]